MAGKLQAFWVNTPSGHLISVAIFGQMAGGAGKRGLQGAVAISIGQNDSWESGDLSFSISYTLVEKALEDVQSASFHLARLVSDPDQTGTLRQCACASQDFCPP